jgi:hypothetical protein
VRNVREPSLPPEDCPALSLPGVELCPNLEQMYLNISTSQLYPPLQGSDLHATLLSTFGLESFSLSRPIRASTGFSHDSKRLALSMFDCQMWRNSHFTPMSKALKRERHVGGHKWEIWGDGATAGLWRANWPLGVHCERHPGKR